MSVEPQFANALTKFLAITPLRNADLAEKVADALNRGVESWQSVDELLMSASKLVDSKLKEALEQFTGTQVGRARGAIDVLQRCVEEGLIRSRDEPVFHYLYWYFTDRRNQSHHEIREYTFSDLVAFMLETQSALEQIASLRSRQRPAEAKFDIKQDPERGQATIDVLQLWQGSSPIRDARLEAVIRRPDRQTDRLPLTQTSIGWGGTYDYRGLPTGSYNFRIQGASAAGAFGTASGANIYVSGRVCAKCGGRLEPFTALCPNCSTNQSGFTYTAPSH